MRRARSEHKGGFLSFVSGALLGVLLGGFTGAGAAAVVLVQHPHFGSRLRTALAGLMTQSDEIAPGSLANVVIQLGQRARMERGTLLGVP